MWSASHFLCDETAPAAGRPRRRGVQAAQHSRTMHQPAQARARSGHTNRQARHRPSGRTPSPSSSSGPGERPVLLPKLSHRVSPGGPRCGFVLVDQPAQASGLRGRQQPPLSLVQMREQHRELHSKLIASLVRDAHTTSARAHPRKQHLDDRQTLRGTAFCWTKGDPALQQGPWADGLPVCWGQRWAPGADADGEPAFDGGRLAACCPLHRARPAGGTSPGPSQKLLLKSKTQVGVPITAHEAGAAIPRTHHGDDATPLRRTRSDLDLKCG